MATRKSYGQFCALARALDHVGDRWTMLIVRELLLGPVPFRALQEALPGLAPNLLVDRLRNLGEDGLVRRRGGPPRSRSVTYELTELGRGLEPALLALIRWGAGWMASGPQDDVVDSRWAVLALRAFVEAPPPAGAPTGRVHVRIGDVDATVDVRRRGRTVAAGAPAESNASVVGSFPDVLSLASGLQGIDDVGLEVEGDERLAAAALMPRGR